MIFFRGSHLVFLISDKMKHKRISVSMKEFIFRLLVFNYSLVLAARTCFVSDLQRGLKIQEAKFNLDGSAQVSAVMFTSVCTH